MNEIVANDTLGAFCRHTHVEMQGAPRGPLAGLTFAVKDIYDVAGVKTGFGNPDWLRTHEPAARTAPAVQMLLDAGARLIGKTHTEEMAWSLTGENAHYGTPINVNAPGRIPGGSSSGSAAAVAAGLVDFAVGSDTGGSVRLPASYCGILGLRPTHGRISLEGVCPLAPSFDTCGWFAREPGVFERVGRVLLRDAAPARAPSRLLVAQDAFAFADETAAAALNPALDKVAALIGAPQYVAAGDEPLTAWGDYFRFPQGAEAWECHREWVTRVKPTFGPAVGPRVAWAAKVAPHDVARARREEIAQRMDALLRDDAVLALPSAPGIAPLRNSPPDVVDGVRSRALPMLCIAGLARLPQVSLPLATLDGCPLGLSLIAARGNDTLLLALARAISSQPSAASR
ncbi:MAG: amidase [Betaproteobacteria bacterium]|nr:amidase [Betaproteobacteria bacterium]